LASHLGRFVFGVVFIDDANDDVADYAQCVDRLTGRATTGFPLDGCAGFDDHLTTVLAEKRGNSRKLLEIRNAD
jgi:hypothetical protein